MIQGGLHLFKDRNGRIITIGDILVTSNDGSDGADEWEAHQEGETVVVDICRHGLTCTAWQPDVDDEDSIFHLKYVTVLTD